MVLISALLAILAGHAVAGVIAAITIPQWLEIAQLVLKAEPIVVQGLKNLHPAFQALHDELEKNGPHAAAQAAHARAMDGPTFVDGKYVFYH